MNDAVMVIGADEPGVDVPIVEGDGTVTARIWPGQGAVHRTMHLLDLAPGSRTNALRHPGEAVYYVVAGQPVVFEDGARSAALQEGAMVHVGAGGTYRFDAGSEPAKLIGGPCPPDPSWYRTPEVHEERGEPDGLVRVFHRDRPGLKVPLISRDARFVVWLGVGAVTANMNYVVLEPGEANTPHHHEESEDTIWVMEGAGTVEDLSNEQRLPVVAGDIIHVPVGVEHAVHADVGERMVSVGGPCPADRHLLKLIGADPG